jgi:hypothetical protein
MGCNCKTNQQISYLQKKYGDKIPVSKVTHIREMVSKTIKTILLVILMIPIVPIFGLFLLIRYFFTKKPINIKKTFKINE